MVPWKCLLTGLVVAVLVLGGGCTKTEEEPAAAAVDREALLLERVHAYNTARLDNDILAVYPMFWSVYREALTLNEHVARPRNIRIKGYEIGEALEMGEAAATVEVVISFSAMGYTFHGRREQQEWVLEDGQWYFKADPGISTPFDPVHTPESEEDAQADGQ